MKKKKKLKMNRRRFLKIGFAGGSALFLPWRFNLPTAFAEIPQGGSLDPVNVPKFVTPMLIPPVMTRTDTIKMHGGAPADYYEVSMIQKLQQILPPIGTQGGGFSPTTVWAYGTENKSKPHGVTIHNAPSLTIEAKHGRPTVIKWINGLVDSNGDYLSHLLPVDPTLHWANPPQGNDPAYGTGQTDSRPTFTSTPGPYEGPVPMITHVHGAVGVGDESDGWTEAWYLPFLPGSKLPAGYADRGRYYDFFKGRAADKFGIDWDPGSATFVYPNENRPSTLWYHDHSLGMTRLNVYAGPAGFYIVRGAGSSCIDTRNGKKAVLPGPAPKENDKFPPNKTYYEIPIAIQDRSFNTDGSLYYPDSRAIFDEIVADYIPDGEFSPIWNPEFFGNMMMVNGNTWPYQTVEKKRYRFRFLNGCQSRFLVLDFSSIPGVEVWAIGNEGGYLKEPVNLTATNDNKLLMALAERADLIVDFTNVGTGNYVLKNVGPDEPFGGFPIDPAALSDRDGTGQIMQFRVVPAVGPDPTTPPEFLKLPEITPLPQETFTRKLALIEEAGTGFDADDNEVEGPVEALLGTVSSAGVWTKRMWADDITENPGVGDTEVWEIYNTTGDAHPMHVHELVFEVVNRQNIIVDEDAGKVEVGDDSPTGPELWETGFKDTVTAYPGQVTRIRAHFKNRGLFVWHCHIVEHEDNEMMRPFRIGDPWDEEPGFGAS